MNLLFLFVKLDILFPIEARYGNCANNCRGVDPNAIIGGGVAAAAATAVAGSALVSPALGVGGLGAAAAVGGAMTMMMMPPCQAPLCRVGLYKH